ncbi:Holliday junction branch migration protein RuvA [Aeromicrobium fastidiosum]|uniref:Holliday junction branch migration complex subunit RuvA n=1 Tax=Aeromicrobium fastidiosum TaxID=52699 RepID=A0A641ALA5_9ACTN|nr:Holliday junction branch migration protein RuvA [Aeromicrobium fastidiosum]KAA1376143.1 Holliday junction branch migration protein RuvA [Aeromicrobium fastidiosum]MBP2391975.1 Holliday junction DNA helicase RuvA [Aeromicrobium fastidiosum]
MIAHVRGPVAAVTLTSAVLDVGGVGLQVMCTPGTIATLRIGREVQLSTSMVVREDSLTIFGFATPDERDMFELVQTASGVGPKVAQAMLAVLDPDRLRQAIGQGDLATLTTVPGIGRKGAERIVVELKDRVGVTTTVAAGATSWRGQVHEALLGLGWSTRDADAALDAVAADLSPGETPDVSTILRDALRSLAKTR